jgi:hypothetical protein
MARNTRLRRKKVPARRARNPANWVITATKHKGGTLYYAGGARLTTEPPHALKFGSETSAARVKKQILTDFPRVLTKPYRWATRTA